MEIASAENKEKTDSERESNPCLSAYGTTELRIIPLADRTGAREALSTPFIFTHVHSLFYFLYPQCYALGTLCFCNSLVGLFYESSTFT